MGEIGAEGHKKDTLGFKSKEDWMKKTNLFVEADGINIMNFVKIGLSVGLSRCDNFNFELNSTYQYTECGKVLLGFNKYLEPTEKFTETIEEAINSEDPVNFMRIIEEYGRFIPTEVIFGGRVYFRDVEKLETHSGENTMNAIVLESNSEFNKLTRNSMRLLGEFRNPVNIFKLLPEELYKQIYEIIVLWNKTDYKVFATVIDTEDSKNVFFNCQILHPSDINVQLIEELYDTKNPHNLKLEIKHAPIVGIPILDKLDISNKSHVIGHYFYTDQDKIGVNIFTYCLKNKQ
ncbi:595_t:CDS:2 [Funneliformis geosporum]|nr:595_t:CDS:2 [Funneliformis geosporum]